MPADFLHQNSTLNVFRLFVFLVRIFYSVTFLETVAMIKMISYGRRIALTAVLCCSKGYTATIAPSLKASFQNCGSQYLSKTASTQITNLKD